MVAAGVVLAGGRSARMGRAKAGLEWHGGTLLFRTAAVLVRAVDGPVVVVRAPGQDLPVLPAGVGTVEDPVADLGPMQGIAAGLAAVRDRAGAAFVCSTDLPFLHPGYVRAVLGGLEDPAVDLVVPVLRGFRQPLAAAYRTTLVDLVEAQLAAGNRQVSSLPDLRPAARPTALPHPESVRNINTPEAYAAARALPGPRVTVGSRPVRAASLGEAGVAAGEVTVNGERIAPDPRWPLVEGDVVEVQAASR